MDLLPTEEQAEIVATVRSQLARNFDLHQLASVDGSAEVIDRALWSQCAELGWFGLGLSEDLGGVGYGLVEEALLFTELGRHATPGPFLATVLAARLAAFTGQGDLAASILSGEQRVALAEAHGDVEATAGATVSGTFRVTDGGGADVVLVIAGGGAALVAAADLPAEPIPSIDLLVPMAIGTVSGAPTLTHLADAADLILHGTVLVAAELAGNTEATAEQSTQYGKDREQFGVPIGSFQADKHRCADMAVRAEASISLTRYAALAVVDELPDAPFHVHAARSMAGASAIQNAQINVQNHGGIGFTWEHTAHRYVTRAQVLARTLGDTRAHLGQLLDQPTPA